MMNYRDTNVQAPDIAQYFKFLHYRVMPHTMGQGMLSDWVDKDPDDPVFGLYRACGFMNYDEAAILYQWAKQAKGVWLDIGGHTGWTALHTAMAGCAVVAIDPMYALPDFQQRATENITRAGYDPHIRLLPVTSQMLFGRDWRRPDVTITKESTFTGVIIDGEHSWEHPMYDAVWSLKHLEDRGVIVLHDFIGGPVREAVKYLKAEGLKCRVYCASSQLLAVCWRGDFTPVPYTPDPDIDWKTVLDPLSATRLIGFVAGKPVMDPTGTQGRGDFYFEECV